MKKTPRVPFAIISCVALALAACDQKSSAENEATRQRQLQEMQNKIEALNSRSEELSRQLADREAAEAESKRAKLEQDQAEVDRQKAQLEADRQALAKTTAEDSSGAVANSGGIVSSDDEEPVYQGKPVGYDLFYDRLQDDGDWIESEGYGYIWQPAVAIRNPRWRPYSDGHWVDTDRGWTWNSNERFGWATYHYGRWVNLSSSGWCWVPGDEWAPAWVSWRSGDRYVGWAPLPPEARLQRGGSITASVDISYGTGPSFFNFVDTEDFGESTYVGRLVEPERNVVIINETVNVTNITYNNTVIRNFGPDYDVIRRRSRRPVAWLQLDLQRGSPNVEGGHSRREGNRLIFAAPVVVKLPGSSDRPNKVSKKIVKIDRDNGWRAVNDDQAQAVKAGLEKRADQKAQQEQAQREQQRRQMERQAQRENIARQPDDRAEKPDSFKGTKQSDDRQKDSRPGNESEAKAGTVQQVRPNGNDLSPAQRQQLEQQKREKLAREAKARSAQADSTTAAIDQQNGNERGNGKPKEKPENAGSSQQAVQQQAARKAWEDSQKQERREENAALNQDRQDAEKANAQRQKLSQEAERQSEALKNKDQAREVEENRRKAAQQQQAEENRRQRQAQDEKEQAVRNQQANAEQNRKAEETKKEAIRQQLAQKIRREQQLKEAQNNAARQQQAEQEQKQRQAQEAPRQPVIRQPQPSTQASQGGQVKNKRSNPETSEDEEDNKKKKKSDD